MFCYGLLRKNQRFRQLRFLPFSSMVVFIMVLIINEILLLIYVDRIRYFIVLWPLTALMIGWAVWQTSGHWRYLVGSFMILWVSYGIWVNVGSEMRYEFYPQLHRYPLLAHMREMEANAGQQELLLIDAQLYDETTAKLFSFADHFMETLVMGDSSHSRAEFLEKIQAELRIWVLSGEMESAGYRAMIADLPPALSFCRRYIGQRNLVLELYTWSTVHCASNELAEMRFGEEIELAASSVSIEASETLRVDLLLQADDATGMTAYSVALHVFDSANGEKVAQGDQGLWLGRYNPVRSEIDISALPAGEYEVRIGLYNWQTLEPLAGVDLASGVSANLLTLSRFEVQ